LAKKRILTGDRPTGALHLGHYVGSLANRVQLQDEYDTFIIIADVQALTTNFEHPEKLPEDVRQVAIDNLSVGLDPEKVTIFIQSMVPQIAEMTIIYSMLVTVNVLRHNPTIKTEAKQYGYQDMTYGFLGYPVSQTADITFCKAHMVPVGVDQVPHLELCRKLVRRFNDMYAPVLVEPEFMVGKIGRLVGTDGNAKMSKSLDNCIYLSDSAAEVAQKISMAITDPARMRRADLGHPDVCTVFAYHNAFNPGFVKELRKECETAGIGCVDCKKRLSAEVNAILEPMRERRAKYELNPKLVEDILRSGTERACQEGAKTMADVREAMHLDYL
jgi:tryptophanyl-tRNA synthetase